jgi:hypothetical protein
MFDALPDPAPAAAPPLETGAQGRMRLARRVSEIGVRMAERLDRQSEAAAINAEFSALPQGKRDDSARRLHEAARAFAQVARAVSICLALEDRIERGPPIAPPEPSTPRRASTESPVAGESRLGARGEEVYAAVRRTIDADRSGFGDPACVDDLCRNLDRLLAREMAAVDAFLDRPVEETIVHICKALNLDPDWTRWAETFGVDDPSPVTGRMGPVPKEREDGAANFKAGSTIASQATQSREATPKGNSRSVSNSPSSHSASPNGAHPSPGRGRIRERNQYSTPPP